MLSKPFAGWTEVTIGSFTDRASYLTDVPVDCLKSMISAYENNAMPFCVSFDAEGWGYTIVIDYYNTYIIHDDDSLKLTTMDTKRDTLALELIEDIERNVDDWIAWDDDGDESDATHEGRKLLLRNLTDKLNYEIEHRRSKYFM